MADTKGSALPEMTTPVGTDLLVAVDDPAGVPATQKVTFTNLAAWLNSNLSVATAGIADDAVTYAKMQNASAGFSVMAKAGTGAGDYAELAAAADGVLRRSGSGDLAFGTIVTGNIADDAVTFPKLLDATQKALIGAGGAGAFSEITLGAGLDITAGALDVVTNAAAASVTANTKSAFLDDDYFFGLDPDNASDDLKEFGLTFANFKTQLNGIYVTLTAVNTQTGMAYTLALTDANDIVEVNNAGANTVTIPTNAAVAFPVGTVIGVTQFGAGATTVTGDTGVTVNGVSAGGAAIDAQYKGVSIYKRATNEWIMQGAHGTVA